MISFPANLIAITDGMAMGWTSPMIPYFLSEKSHIKMTMKEAEWIENFVLIGAVCALPMTIYLVNKIGRRKAMMTSCFLLIVCWIIIGLANHITYIYIARFAQGLGVNMAFVAMPMYIGEISHKNIRGRLTASTFIFLLVGVLVIYCIGPYVPYVVPPILASGILAIEFIAFLFLPESPYHLLLIGKREEAKNSLRRFRGGCNVDGELYELQSSMDKSMDEGGNLKDLFTIPNNRRASLIMFLLNATQLFGGFEVIMMNLHEILKSADSVYLDSSLVAIIYAITMLLGSVLSSLVVDRFGRKILLTVSTLTSGICILTLAFYFNFKALEYDIKNISWIPLVAIMAYAICFKVGLGTVSIVITAEIFASRIKALGMTIADGVYTVASIAALQIFFVLKDTYGMHAPFYIFSGCLFSVLPFLIFLLPETKGKSLDEIQEMLKMQKCC